jgi:hypothetical protein
MADGAGEGLQGGIDALKDTHTTPQKKLRFLAHEV